MFDPQNRRTREKIDKLWDITLGSILCSLPTFTMMVYYLAAGNFPTAITLAFLGCAILGIGYFIFYSVDKEIP